MDDLFGFSFTHVPDPDPLSDQTVIPSFPYYTLDGSDTPYVADEIVITAPRNGSGSNFSWSSSDTVYQSREEIEQTIRLFDRILDTLGYDGIFGYQGGWSAQYGYMLAQYSNGSLDYVAADVNVSGNFLSVGGGTHGVVGSVTVFNEDGTNGVWDVFVAGGVGTSGPSVSVGHTNNVQDSFSGVSVAVRPGGLYPDNDTGTIGISNGEVSVTVGAQVATIDARPVGDAYGEFRYNLLNIPHSVNPWNDPFVYVE